MELGIGKTKPANPTNNNNNNKDRNGSKPLFVLCVLPCRSLIHSPLQGNCLWHDKGDKIVVDLLRFYQDFFQLYNFLMIRAHSFPVVEVESKVTN